MSWIYGMIVILIQLSSKSTIRNQHVVSATPLLQGKNIVCCRYFAYICARRLAALRPRLVYSFSSPIWILFDCMGLVVYLRDIDVIPSTRQVFLSSLRCLHISDCHERRLDLSGYMSWLDIASPLLSRLRGRIETKKIIRKVRWILITKLPKKMRKKSSREIPSRS